jgi:hypothetical protein
VTHLNGNPLNIVQNYVTARGKKYETVGIHDVPFEIEEQPHIQIILVVQLITLDSSAPMLVSVHIMSHAAVQLGE